MFLISDVSNQSNDYCIYENAPSMKPDPSLIDACLEDSSLDDVLIAGTDIDTTASLRLEIDWGKTIAKSVIFKIKRLN